MTNSCSAFIEGTYQSGRKYKDRFRFPDNKYKYKLDTSETLGKRAKLQNPRKGMKNEHPHVNQRRHESVHMPAWGYDHH